ncbi:MAG TPA: hypothetical protein DEB46_07590 [Myxococcales bacterium]|nr:hypothetical protein [Myxococcales bacterium]HBU48161.1 hypothetical protein [Myxococcales bacterium]
MSRRVWISFALLGACLPSQPEPAPQLNSPERPARPPSPPVVDAGMRVPEDAGAPVQLTEINPAEGPSLGGTRVQLRGEGLAADSQVFIGGEPVLDMLLRNQRIITFRTPPGHPGPTTLRVINSLGEATLEDAFTYFDSLRIETVEPSIGPRAGGLEVVLRGDGFDRKTAVLIGGRSLVDPELISAQEIRGFVPPAIVPGIVDLEVIKDYGRQRLARAFTYRPDLQVQGVDPEVVMPGQPAYLTIFGLGFEPGLEVQVGAQECLDVRVMRADLATCTLAGLEEVGAYPIIVRQPGETHRLLGGFRRLQPFAGRQLQALSPTQAPPSGGQDVVLYGSGFDQSLRRLSFGEIEAPLLSVQPNQLISRVPPHEAGQVAIRLLWDDGHTSTLPAAFHYVDDLFFEALEPASGPRSGGQQVILNGRGLCPELQVYLAGRAQPLVSVAADQAVFQTLSAPGGAAELRLVCPDQTLVVPDAFLFEAELEIYGLHPRRGAVAGGTLVSVAGQGFSDPTFQLQLGDQDLSVDVVSDQVLRFRTPPASPGWVDLRAQQRGVEAGLDAVFEYYEPGFRYGGTRGGQVRGAVNVTVLNQYTNLGPIEGVTVALDSVGSPGRTALTDLRGQVTFSELDLEGPQTVTAFKSGCQRSVSVVEVEAADITLWMACPPPPPDPSEGGGGGAQPPSQPARLAGRITGFSKALFDPAVLGPDQRAVAKLYLTQRTPDGGRPWLGGADEVWGEGERYVVTVNPGRYTLIAIAGIWDDNEGKIVQQLQMGMRRNITALSGEYKDGMDIDLAYGMDRTVLVQFAARAEPLEGQVGPNRYQVRTVLDLGGDGYFPLQNKISQRAPVLLRGLPEAPGELFRFIGGLATGQSGASPSSIVRIRGGGQLAGGITLGPLLPFPEFQAPAFNGQQLEDHLLRWKLPEEGERPDYIELDLTGPGGSSWMIYVHGDQRKVRIPRMLDARRLGAPGEPGEYQVSMTLISAPGFDLDNFSFLETWGRDRRAFSRSRVQFTLP